MTLALIYCLIALGFLIPTLFEGNKAKLGWGVNRLAGLAACLGWPLTVAALMIASTRNAALA